jgi:hypothetical protein
MGISIVRTVVGPAAQPDALNVASRPYSSPSALSTALSITVFALGILRPVQRKAVADEPVSEIGAADRTARKGPPSNVTGTQLARRARKAWRALADCVSAWTFYTTKTQCRLPGSQRRGSGIGPVGKLSIPNPTENFVEFGFANQEGVMLRRDFAVGVHVIEIGPVFSVTTL